MINRKTYTNLDQTDCCHIDIDPFTFPLVLDNHAILKSAPAGCQSSRQGLNQCFIQKQSGGYGAHDRVYGDSAVRCRSRLLTNTTTMLRLTYNCKDNYSLGRWITEGHTHKCKHIQDGSPKARQAICNKWLRYKSLLR